MQKIVTYNQDTLTLWQESIDSIIAYDSNQHIAIINPLNLIDYVLSIMELMTQEKQYNNNSFILSLIKYAEIAKKNVKQFLKAFIQSYKIHYLNVPELAYLTKFLNSYELQNKSSQNIRFYIKVRKYIYSNYVNSRESYQKSIKLDDWVSIVLKFLDNQAITHIGERIKNELKQNNTDKVLHNSILPLDLLIFCCEYYEQDNNNTNKINWKENIQNEVSTFQIEQNKQQNKSASQIAYGLIMNKNEKKNQFQQHLIKTQKYIEVTKQHENLAYNYKLLANYITDVQDIAKTLIQQVFSKNKIQNGKIDQSQLQHLEQICNYNSYSKNDAIQDLYQTNIYDFI